MLPATLLLAEGVEYEGMGILVLQGLNLNVRREETVKGLGSPLGRNLHHQFPAA